MNHYSANRGWSDQFPPQIKRIASSHLLETAPDPLDWHQATDLLMLDAATCALPHGRAGEAMPTSTRTCSPFALALPQG